MVFPRLSTIFYIVILSVISGSNASSYEDAGLYGRRRNRKGHHGFLASKRKKDFHQQQISNYAQTLFVSSTETIGTTPITPGGVPSVDQEQDAYASSPSSSARVWPSPVDQEQKNSSSSPSSSGKMWPPWPFNLINQKNTRGGSGIGTKQSNHKNMSTSTNGGQTAGYRSAVQLFCDYFSQRGRFGIRQLKQVGSDLWFNLPPAAPPLLLLAAFPKGPFAASSSPSTILEAGTEVVAESARAFPPLFANVFARKLALGYLGVAILSWSNSEIYRKRRLVPLPLAEQYKDVQRALLPQFLPESIPQEDPDYVVVTEHESKERGTEEIVTATNNKGDDDVVEDTIPIKMLSSVPPKLRRHLQNMYDGAPSSRTLKSTFRDWGKMREQRKRDVLEVKRLVIVDELRALRSFKEKAKENKKIKSKITSTSKQHKQEGNRLGYALVTGASRGIGRALAVELARWEIPLILVARDLNPLTDLANELETCYGVKCCVLQADLSQSGVASKIHQTTRDCGLQVDILVNNAGVCSTGLSVDMPTDEVQRMIQINTMSVAMLNHLYGKDMKDNGRGRIMVVSSIVGCVPAGPNVATYAATKAFEKSMALSMGKELEPYGVGVTCLMPGAVRNTSFRSRSGSETALCWNLPFYTRTAPTVAHEGVRAMLSGQTEVCPGWQNRAFVKLMIPMIPQRLTTLMVEAAWSPLRLPWQKRDQDDETDASGQPTVKRAIRTDPADIVPYHDDSIVHLGKSVPYQDDPIRAGLPRILTLPREEERGKGSHTNHKNHQMDEARKDNTDNITTNDSTNTSTESTSLGETTTTTESPRVSDVVENSVEEELSKFNNEVLNVQDEIDESNNEARREQRTRESNQKLDEDLSAEPTTHKSDFNSNQFKPNEASEMNGNLHHQDHSEDEQSKNGTKKDAAMPKSTNEQTHGKNSRYNNNIITGSPSVPDKEVSKKSKEESRPTKSKRKNKKKAKVHTLDDFATELEAEYFDYDLYLR